MTFFIAMLVWLDFFISLAVRLHARDGAYGGPLPPTPSDDEVMSARRHAGVRSLVPLADPVTKRQQAALIASPRAGRGTGGKPPPDVAHVSWAVDLSGRDAAASVVQQQASGVLASGVVTKRI